MLSWTIYASFHCFLQICETCWMPLVLYMTKDMLFVQQIKWKNHAHIINTCALKTYYDIQKFFLEEFPLEQWDRVLLHFKAREQLLFRECNQQCINIPYLSPIVRSINVDGVRSCKIKCWGNFHICSFDKFSLFNLTKKYLFNFMLLDEITMLLF